MTTAIEAIQASPVWSFLHSSADARRLFITRSLRLFAYGFLAVVLALYLAEVGLSETRIGLLLTLTLVGDTLISLWMTMTADQFGRRRTLVLGAGLMLGAGLLFGLTDSFILLLFAATIGVISPSGNEIGPFLSIEQAALTSLASDRDRTTIFAWYHLIGSGATALGALAGGVVAQILQNLAWSPLASYRVVVLAYGGIGLLLALIFARVSSAIEAPPAKVEGLETTLQRRFGLHRSQGIVLRLSALFALDAFGGGFIVQSIIAYWFYVRFGAEPGVLGGIFFGANVLAGLSALLAARVAQKIGLINTMVFTHIPSNLLLMLVPLMPTLPLAVLVLLVRYSISQMDVPTRQSYTMAVVSPDERSAASGITTVARSVGAALAPVLTGPLLAVPALINAPFFICGTLKIIYDLWIWRDFRALKPPEEV